MSSLAFPNRYTIQPKFQHLLLGQSFPIQKALYAYSAHRHTHTRTHTHTHTHTSTYTHGLMFLSSYAYMHTYIQTLVHTYTHEYTLPHIQKTTDPYIHILKTHHTHEVAYKHRWVMCMYASIPYTRAISFVCLSKSQMCMYIGVLSIQTFMYAFEKSSLKMLIAFNIVCMHIKNKNTYIYTKVFNFDVLYHYRYI